MKKFAVLASVAGFGLALATPAFAASPMTGIGVSDQTIISQQDTCQEGQTWNDATQKCE